MSHSIPTTEVFYPESDGQPMGETPLHQEWMFWILSVLKYFYRDQNVYVAGDMLLYYEEGLPARYLVPDAFVALDCDPQRPRRVYKTWEEGKMPEVVFEVTSLGTFRDDMIRKLQLYDQLGVQEYFLFDPEAEYLSPPLQGFRRSPRGLERITEIDGTLTCNTLGIELRRVGNDLQMFESATQARLLTEAQAEHQQMLREREAKERKHQRMLQERAAKLREREAKEAAEKQNRELQAELEQLKKQLQQRRDTDHES